MEWDNLDEIMPNEITKFDQNQISKRSHQLAAASYYFSGKNNGSLKRHAETLKAVIGKAIKSGETIGQGPVGLVSALQ